MGREGTRSGGDKVAGRQEGTGGRETRELVMFKCYLNAIYRLQTTNYSANKRSSSPRLSHTKSG